jgi:hypothetical protein
MDTEFRQQQPAEEREREADGPCTDVQVRVNRKQISVFSFIYSIYCTTTSARRQGFFFDTEDELRHVGRLLGARSPHGPAGRVVTRSTQHGIKMCFLLLSLQHRKGQMPLFLLFFATIAGACLTPTGGFIYSRREAADHPRLDRLTYHPTRMMLVK